MAANLANNPAPAAKRWLVLAAAVLINFCNGIGYTWSVFVNPLHEAHGWSASELAFAFTLSMGFVAPVAMVASAFLQKIRGPKLMIVLSCLLAGCGIFCSGYARSIAVLYLTYGICFGFGFNVTNSLIMGSVVHFFPDRRGLALGCVLTGLASGSAILAPLAAWMVGRPALSVGGTFRLLGIGFLVVTGLCSLLFKNPPQQAPARQDPGNRTWQSAMLRDGSFYVIALMFVAAAYAGVTLISNASPIGQSMFSLSPQTASLAISVIAVSNALGRLSGGALNDRIGGVATLRLLYAATAALLLSLALLRSQPLFILAMTGIGFCYGICMVTFPAMISARYGARHFVLNYGITFTAFAVTAYFAPKVSAVIRTRFAGDFTWAFYIAAAVCLLGIALTFLFRGLLRRKLAD
jgi:OFA family oxalate/formate antiporter-like MFS transporter